MVYMYVLFVNFWHFAFLYCAYVQQTEKDGVTFYVLYDVIMVIYMNANRD